jgi:hypothetical protein
VKGLFAKIQKQAEWEEGGWLQVVDREERRYAQGRFIISPETTNPPTGCAIQWGAVRWDELIPLWHLRVLCWSYSAR